MPYARGHNGGLPWTLPETLEVWPKYVLARLERVHMWADAGLADLQDLDLEASGTSSAVGLNSLTDGAATMTVDAHADAVLSDSLGAEFPIVSNTATAFVLTGGTPAAGAYSVVRQATADARAEAIRAALGAHLASVGTAASDGAHKAADTAIAATLAAIPAASGLATCITLILGIQTAADSHGDSAGVHFNDDATLAASSLTPNPPVTLVDCYDDLDEILAEFADHYARASVPGFGTEVALALCTALGV